MTSTFTTDINQPSLLPHLMPFLFCLETRDVQSVVKRTLFISDNRDFGPRLDAWHQYVRENKLENYSRRINGTQQCVENV